jgi:hypothetical protein
METSYLGVSECPGTCDGEGAISGGKIVVFHMAIIRRAQIVSSRHDLRKSAITGDAPTRLS